VHEIATEAHDPLNVARALWPVRRRVLLLVSLFDASGTLFWISKLQKFLSVSVAKRNPSSPDSMRPSMVFCLGMSRYTTLRVTRAAPAMNSLSIRRGVGEFVRVLKQKAAVTVHE
jgi:hypothetical protein